MTGRVDDSLHVTEERDSSDVVLDFSGGEELGQVRRFVEDSEEVV